MSYDLVPVSGFPAATFDTTNEKFGTAAFLANGALASTALGSVANHPMASLISGGKFSDGTIEFYYRRSAPPAGLEVVLGAPGSFWIGVDGSGAPVVHIGSGPTSYGPTTDTALATTSPSICDGAEHHFALVNRASDGSTTVYVDEAPRGTSTTNPTVYTSVYEGVVVGGLQYGVNPAVYGYTSSAGSLDDLAFSNTRQYTGAFTPPTSAFVANRPGQIALYHFDGDLKDAVGATSATAATILPNDPNFIYSPGAWDITAARAKTINTGSKFRVLIQGSATALTLLFDVSANATPLPQIMVRVDRGPWLIQEIAASVALTIPTGATWASHLVEFVVKAMTETQPRWNPQTTGVSFLGIAASPSSCSSVPIFPAPLHGIVNGDSITEAVRVDQMTASSGKDTDRNDASIGWADELSAILGAEVGPVGFGATGWVATGSGGVPAFTSTYALLWGGGPARSFAGLDFIVINHGTNDSGFTDATVTAAVIQALNGILAASNGLQIFVMRPFNGSKATAIQAGIAACANPARVSYVDTTGWWSPADSSDSLHPYGYADVALLAPRLAAAIRAKLRGVSNRWVRS